jgi:peptidoglycan/xylan/chitin deacetylase (PgdA/CDA1 family)
MVSIVRRTLLKASGSPLFARCIARIEGRPDRRFDQLRVLMYHRVAHAADRPDLATSLISATPPDFNVQMEHIAEHYHPLSARELLDSFDAGQPLRPRSVLVTFDDGYRDFAQHAWPVLRRLGIPAVLFVATAYVADPSRRFWWDRLHVAVRNLEPGQPLQTPCGERRVSSDADRANLLRELRSYVKSLPHESAMRCVDSICSQLPRETGDNGVLSREDLQRLSREGVTIAPHTRTHPLLNRLGPEQAAAEISGSCHDLADWIGERSPLFAYPSGGVDPASVAAVRRAGVELAFTTRRGHSNLGACDPFQLRRINVGRATSLPLFRAQLLSQARWLNPCWRA